MSSIRIPREFASDTNYATGSASGTATKTDPGAALVAQGIVPGVAMAQHINYELNELAVAAKQAQLAGLRQRALILHELRNDGITITDNAQSLGAVQANAGAGALLVKTAQSFLAGDMCQPFEQGVPASITSLVTDAAYKASISRVIAVGTGGNRNTFTDDYGSTWTAGGNIGQTPVRIVYNAPEDTWTVTAGATDVRFSADDGVSWATAVGAGVDAPAGLAVVSNGDTFSISTINAIRKSTNGGSSWTTVAGAVPDSANLDDAGTVAGNTGAVFYHCGRFSGGAVLRVASSANGATWTSVATISNPVGRTFTGRPRLMLCLNSGLMVIAAPLSSTRLALYASHDLGVTWTDPVFMVDPTVNAFSVCGGKLFYSRDTQIFASDGVAY